MDQQNADPPALDKQATVRNLLVRSVLLHDCPARHLFFAVVFVSH
jgi:hypothetical protein